MLMRAITNVRFMPSYRNEGWFLCKSYTRENRPNSQVFVTVDALICTCLLVWFLNWLKGLDAALMARLPPGGPRVNCATRDEIARVTTVLSVAAQTDSHSLKDPRSRAVFHAHQRWDSDLWWLVYVFKENKNCKNYFDKQKLGKLMLW